MKRTRSEQTASEPDPEPTAQAIVALCATTGKDAAETLTRLISRWVRSDLDTSAVITGIEDLPKPQEFQQALRALAGHCSDGTLGSCDFYAVRAAVAGSPGIVEALLALAGLTYRQVADQLQRADIALPASISASWTAYEPGLKALFELVDSVVRGTGRYAPAATPKGFKPARPIEMLWGEVVGWPGVARALTDGVSIGSLLAQRAVGSAYRQHRDSTSALVSKAVADNIEAQLLEAEIPFLRVGTAGISAKHVRGLLSSRGGVSFVIPNGSPKYAIAIRIANDPGTAKSAAAQLVGLSPRGVVLACVVVGPGWASRPRATAAAAQHLKGRLFSDRHVPELLADIRTTLVLEDHK